MLDVYLVHVWNIHSSMAANCSGSPGQLALCIPSCGGLGRKDPEFPSGLNCSLILSSTLLCCTNASSNLCTEMVSEILHTHPELFILNWKNDSPLRPSDLRPVSADPAVAVQYPHHPLYCNHHLHHRESGSTLLKAAWSSFSVFQATFVTDECLLFLVRFFRCDRSNCKKPCFHVASSVHRLTSICACISFELSHFFCLKIPSFWCIYT